ncbi:hypothetical protein QQF64_033980 [Cirrhinus molitorella]|uniref:small monomeric GTPase n=1 Tax=Cirrhinus molitorella TaxID=172907 RepID=A0ABR3MVG1_9TELE
MFSTCSLWDSTNRLYYPPMVVQVKSRIRHSSKTMEGNQQKVEANVLLLGAENVGKSALTVRFLTRRFIGEYGDIESIYSHTDKIDGRDICFNIWDSLCPQCIRQAKQKLASTAQIIIVGNKRDLQHRRTVSSEEGRLLALSADCGFFEVSAAETYHGVLMVFHELFELIREARALKKGTAGFKGIVRSMSAVFGRKRTE